MPRFQAEHAGQFNARRAAGAAFFAVGTDGVPIPQHPPFATRTGSGGHAGQTCHCLSRASPDRGMAIKPSFSAVYARQIRKRSKRRTNPTKSPARSRQRRANHAWRTSGVTAVWRCAAPSALFRAGGKTSAASLRITAGHDADGLNAGQREHCLARTQGAPCAPPGIARPPPGRAILHRQPPEPPLDVTSP
ncbi:hypothetical protein SAMN05444398_10949 [Roseovarius pacificus]|uniref:Uncharacterized protein n=1 Tax=Roseovarius pacificus TaxID=337701 RepID=A0A1M7FME1_9RHOB|nr:hypothetical protein SAMN05444398_10949 [Roseovarius pacificus]